MPDVEGLAAISLIRAALPQAGIIVMTLMDALYYRPAVLAAGADHFVSKTNLNADLLPAIQRVAETYSV